jgi:L-asparagine transporter-like permease
VIREVNKIFFDIFSGKKKDQKTRIYDIMFKVMWIPMIVFLVMILTLPFYTFENEEIVLTILLGLIVLLLSFVTVSTYLNVPNSNNQMEQSI